jgi:hypothetical protein
MSEIPGTIKNLTHEQLQVIMSEIPGTIKNLTHEQLQEFAWALYKRVGKLEREKKFSKVSRLEVIGPESREYVRYFKNGEFMSYDLQDDDKTLKVFIGSEEVSDE